MEAVLIFAEVKAREADAKVEGYTMVMGKIDPKGVKTGLPKVGKKVIQAKDPENVILVYPKNEEKADSEETKKIVKKVLAPKTTEIQVRGMRKIQKGGVAMETGNKTAAQKIRQMTATNESIKCTRPKRALPKLLIYDVEQDMTEDEFNAYIFRIFKIGNSTKQTSMGL